MKIYCASKVKYAPLWLKFRETGVNIISTWIDEAGPGQSKSYKDLSLRCFQEVSQCDFVVLYCEDEDILKGALMEVGAAIALGKRVICVGWCASISPVFIFHPLWHNCDTLENALKQSDL